MRNRGRSFNRDFLHSLIRHELIESNFALQLDPAFSLESGSRLFAEAQEAGADFAVCTQLLGVIRDVDALLSAIS